MASGMPGGMSGPPGGGARGTGVGSSGPAPTHTPTPAPAPAPVSAAATEEMVRYVTQLTNMDTVVREVALLELSKKREEFPDLAPLLWHSFGTIAALLQEIIAIYPMLSPPTLSAPQSNRVCNALALLQCVASHAETRNLFLQSYIPLYLYPFLNTASRAKPFEYLRLTSLGVIGALVKMDDAEVVAFLLTTDIIPMCLRIMETGSELSKTVATFIVQKILMDDAGLTYICATPQRFFTVAAVLGNMVAAIAEAPSHRLLKHIIRCYLRLVDNQRARDELRTQLPQQLKDTTFFNVLRNDRSALTWLQQLIRAVYPDAPMTGVAGAALPGSTTGPTGSMTGTAVAGMGQ